MMSKAPVTFEVFTAYIKDSVERIGLTIEPEEGDWTPTGFAVGHSDQMGVLGLLDTPPEEYPRALRAFGEEMNARMVGIVISMWGVEMTPRELDALPEEYRPAEDLGRRYELLMVGVGDAKHEVWWRAPILRSKTKVALGLWEVMPPATKGRQCGSLKAACVR